MRALRFELKGETAFFKKPDVNAYAYFTYSHIHKVALLGLFGAIIGLKGYTQQHLANHPLTQNQKKSKNIQIFPEFYEKLQHAKISIRPHGDRGYFPKKIQAFNNTVGYANKQGGTLNVREQWLENPHWTLYLADDEHLFDGMFEKLADNLLSSQCVFFPYLGKKDHPATILDPAVIEVSPHPSPTHIDSIHCSETIRYDGEGDIRNGEKKSYFRELMPIALNKAYNGYVFKPHILSNYEIDSDSISEEDQHRLYSDQGNIIYFI